MKLFGLPRSKGNQLILPLFLLVGSTLAAEQLEKKASLDWMAFGDLRSYIEPCGCDPATDLGGILRLGKFVAMQRETFKRSLFFNLGNNVDFSSTAKKLKNYYILHAIEKLRPTASLVNVSELDSISHLSPKGNYLLSNLKVVSRFSKINSQIITKEAFIVGYLSPFSSKNIELLSFDEDLNKKWVKGFGKYPKKKKVLLFSGSSKDLKKIQGKKIFDLIISSNQAKMDSVVDGSERAKPRLLLRSASTQEKVVYQTPVGGQGVLLGGRLRFKQRQSLTSLLANDQTTSFMGSKKKILESNLEFLKKEKIVAWLTPDYNTDSPLQSLMDQYNQKTAEDFKEKSKERIKQLGKSPYIGSEACKKCHPTVWKKWKSSKHSSAIQTLIKKGKEQDPECVQCHVLALNSRGGYVSLKASPQFASVQCENCHGPSKSHVIDSVAIGSRNAKTVCKSCHHAPHTTKFDYKSYWKKIEH